MKIRPYATSSKLSPHYEEGGNKAKSPKSNTRTSRFGGKTPISARKLDGSLKQVEKNRQQAVTSIQTPIRTPKSNGINCRGVEYTVTFEPGPIGLKLEPVLKNGSKEFGCRVLKIIETGKGRSSPTQALKSGKINVGDVIVSINCKSVTSKAYKEIVSLLTASTSDRVVTFRIPRSPAKAMPMTPHSTVRSGIDAVNALKTPSIVKHDEDNDDSMFSPSFVKKISRSTVKDSSTFYTPRHPTKPITDVLSTVMKNVAPVMSTAKQSQVATNLSKQIGQTFAGRSSKESDETIRMKMVLLSELSEAKASLGEQEKSMKMMTKIMNEIHKEKLAVLSEKDNLQEELSVAQKAKVNTLM